jgi:hypothetical protein
MVATDRFSRQFEAAHAQVAGLSGRLTAVFEFLQYCSATFRIGLLPRS